MDNKTIKNIAIAVGAIVIGLFLVMGRHYVVLVLELICAGVYFGTDIFNK